MGWYQRRVHGEARWVRCTVRSLVPVRCVARLPKWRSKKQGRKSPADVHSSASCTTDDLSMLSLASARRRDPTPTLKRSTELKGSANRSVSDSKHPPTINKHTFCL